MTGFFEVGRATLSGGPLGIQREEAGEVHVDPEGQSGMSKLPYSKQETKP